MGVAVGNMIEPFVNKEFHMLKWMFSHYCVVPLLGYLFLHYLCPQAQASAALEAMYVT